MAPRKTTNKKANNTSKGGNRRTTVTKRSHAVIWDCGSSREPRSESGAAVPQTLSKLIEKPLNGNPKRDSQLLDWSISPVLRSRLKKYTIKSGHKDRTFSGGATSADKGLCAGGVRALRLNDGSVGKVVKSQSRKMSSTPKPKESKRWRTKSANSKTPKKPEKGLLSRLKILSSELTVSWTESSKTKSDGQDLTKDPNSCAKVEKGTFKQNARVSLPVPCVPEIVDMAGDGAEIRCATPACEASKTVAMQRREPTAARPMAWTQNVSEKHASASLVVSPSNTQGRTPSHSGRTNECPKTSLIVENLEPFTLNQTNICGLNSTQILLNHENLTSPSVSRRRKQKTVAGDGGDKNLTVEASVVNSSASPVADTNKTTEAGAEQNSLDICTLQVPIAVLEQDEKGENGKSGDSPNDMLDVHCDEESPGMSHCPSKSISLILDPNEDYLAQVRASPDQSGEVVENLPVLSGVTNKLNVKNNCRQISAGNATANLDEEGTGFVESKKCASQSSNKSKSKTNKFCEAKETPMKSPFPEVNVSGSEDNSDSKHHNFIFANCLDGDISDSLISATDAFESCFPKVDDYTILDLADRVNISLTYTLKNFQEEKLIVDYRSTLDNGATLCFGGESSNAAKTCISDQEFEKSLEGVEQKLHSPKFFSTSLAGREKFTPYVENMPNFSGDSRHEASSNRLHHDQEGQYLSEYDRRTTCFRPNRKRKLCEISCWAKEEKAPEPPCKRLRLDQVCIDFEDDSDITFMVLSPMTDRVLRKSGVESRLSVAAEQHILKEDYCDVSFSTPEHDLDQDSFKFSGESSDEPVNCLTTLPNTCSAGKDSLVELSTEQMSSLCHRKVQICSKNTVGDCPEIENNYSEQTGAGMESPAEQSGVGKESPAEQSGVGKGSPAEQTGAGKGSPTEQTDAGKRSPVEPPDAGMGIPAEPSDAEKPSVEPPDRPSAEKTSKEPSEPSGAGKRTAEPLGLLERSSSEEPGDEKRRSIERCTDEPGDEKISPTETPDGGKVSVKQSAAGKRSSRRNRSVKTSGSGKGVYSKIPQSEGCVESPKNKRCKICERKPCRSSSCEEMSTEIPRETGVVSDNISETLPPERNMDCEVLKPSRSPSSAKSPIDTSSNMTNIKNVTADNICFLAEKSDHCRTEAELGDPASGTKPKKKFKAKNSRKGINKSLGVVDRTSETGSHTSDCETFDHIAGVISPEIIPVDRLNPSVAILSCASSTGTQDIIPTPQSKLDSQAEKLPVDTAGICKNISGGGPLLENISTKTLVRKAGRSRSQAVSETACMTCPVQKKGIIAPVITQTSPHESNASANPSSFASPSHHISDMEDAFSPGGPVEVQVSETIRREAGINLKACVVLDRLPLKKKTKVGNLTLIRKGRAGKCYWQIKSRNVKSSDLSDKREWTYVIDPKGSSHSHNSSDSEVIVLEKLSTFEHDSSASENEQPSASGTPSSDTVQHAHSPMPERALLTGVHTTENKFSVSSIENVKKVCGFETVQSPKMKQKKPPKKKSPKKKFPKKKSPKKTPPKKNTEMLTDFELAISKPVSEGKKKKSKEAAERLRRKSSEESNSGENCPKVKRNQDIGENNLVIMGEIPRFSGPLKSKIAQNILRKKAEDELEKSKPQQFEVDKPVSFLEILHGNPVTGNSDLSAKCDSQSISASGENAQIREMMPLESGNAPTHKTATGIRMVPDLPLPSSPLPLEIDLDCNYTEQPEEIPFSNFMKPNNVLHSKQTRLLPEISKLDISILNKQAKVQDRCMKKPYVSSTHSPRKLTFGTAKGTKQSLTPEKGEKIKLKETVSKEKVLQAFEDVLEEMDFTPLYEPDSDEESVPSTREGLSMCSSPGASGPVLQIPDTISFGVSHPSKSHKPPVFGLTESSLNYSQSPVFGFRNVPSSNASACSALEEESLDMVHVNFTEADTCDQRWPMENPESMVLNETDKEKSNCDNLWDEYEDDEISNDSDTMENSLEGFTEKSMNVDRTYVTVDETDCGNSFLGVTLDETGECEPMGRMYYGQADDTCVEEGTGLIDKGITDEFNDLGETEECEVEEQTPDVAVMSPPDSHPAQDVQTALDKDLNPDNSRSGEPDSHQLKLTSPARSMVEPNISSSILLLARDKAPKPRRKRLWRTREASNESSDSDDDAVSLHAPSEASFLHEEADLSQSVLNDDVADMEAFCSDTPEPTTSHTKSATVHSKPTPCQSPFKDFKIPRKTAKRIMGPPTKMPKSPITVGAVESVVMGKTVKKSLLGEKAKVPPEYCPPTFFNFPNCFPPGHCIEYLLNGECKAGTACKFEKHSFINKAEGAKLAVNVIETCQKGQLNKALLAYHSFRLLDMSTPPENTTLSLLHHCCKQGATAEALDILTDICSGCHLWVATWTKLYQLFADDKMKYREHISLLVKAMISFKLRPEQNWVSDSLRGCVECCLWEDLWRLLTYCHEWFQVSLGVKIRALQALREDPKHLLALAAPWIEAQDIMSLILIHQDLLKTLTAECQSLGFSTCTQIFSKALSASLDPRRDFASRYGKPSAEGVTDIISQDNSSVKGNIDTVFGRIKSCGVTCNWVYLGELFVEICQEGINAFDPTLHKTFLDTLLKDQPAATTTAAYKSFVETALKTAMTEEAQSCLNKEFLAKIGVELLAFFYSHKGWKHGMDILFTLEDCQLHSFLTMKVEDQAMDVSIMTVETAIYKMQPLFAIRVLNRCFSGQIRGAMFLSSSLPVKKFKHCLYLFRVLVEQLLKRQSREEILQLLRVTLDKCPGLKDSLQEAGDLASSTICHMLSDKDVNLAEKLFKLSYDHRLPIQPLVVRALLVGCNEMCWLDKVDDLFRFCKWKIYSKQNVDLPRSIQIEALLSNVEMKLIIEDYLYQVYLIVRDKRARQIPYDEREFHLLIMVTNSLDHYPDHPYLPICGPNAVPLAEQALLSMLLDYFNFQAHVTVPRVIRVTPESVQQYFMALDDSHAASQRPVPLHPVPPHTAVLPSQGRVPMSRGRGEMVRYPGSARPGRMGPAARPLHQRGRAPQTRQAQVPSSW